MCNRKQGHYSDRRTCEMMTLNEITMCYEIKETLAQFPHFMQVIFI